MKTFPLRQHDPFPAIDLIRTAMIGPGSGFWSLPEEDRAVRSRVMDAVDAQAAGDACALEDADHAIVRDAMTSFQFGQHPNIVAVVADVANA